MPDRSPASLAEPLPVLAPTGAPVDLKACTALMRGGSKSFFAASLLLPAHVRGHAIALYAFCRVADDVVDEGGRDGTGVAALHARLRQVYSGAPLQHPEDHALSSVVARCGIPSPLLVALLEGFHWDAEGRRYETLDDLHHYAARVAGTVGAMMAIVMGTRSSDALARACELGVAMQLTNIARDVGEDARNGRLYLPRLWMREAGLDPDAWLARPVFNSALASVVKRVLGAADELYARAEHGISALPRSCRPAIQAARLIYAEIGRQVERARYDSVSMRAVVPARRKAMLMVRALAAAAVGRRRTLASIDPLPAVRFLVEAAGPATAGDRLDGRRPRLSFHQRTIRIIELMEEVAHRQRAWATAAGEAGDAR